MSLKRQKSVPVKVLECHLPLSCFLLSFPPNLPLSAPSFELSVHPRKTKAQFCGIRKLARSIYMLQNPPQGLVGQHLTFLSIPLPTLFSPSLSSKSPQHLPFTACAHHQTLFSFPPFPTPGYHSSLQAALVGTVTQNFRHQCSDFSLETFHGRMNMVSHVLVCYFKHRFSVMLRCILITFNIKLNLLNLPCFIVIMVLKFTVFHSSSLQLTKLLRGETEHQKFLVV